LNDVKKRCCVTTLIKVTELGMGSWELDVQPSCMDRKAWCCCYGFRIL